MFISVLFAGLFTVSFIAQLSVKLVYKEQFAKPKLSFAVKLKSTKPEFTTELFAG
ncbi:hypothetical protein ES703_68531 [subsurface metagenome]